MSLGMNLKPYRQYLKSEKFDQLQTPEFFYIVWELLQIVNGEIIGIAIIRKLI